jgi:hypothetical protein
MPLVYIYIYIFGGAMNNTLLKTKCLILKIAF